MTGPAFFYPSDTVPSPPANHHHESTLSVCTYLPSHIPVPPLPAPGTNSRRVLTMSLVMYVSIKYWLSLAMLSAATWSVCMRVEISDRRRTRIVTRRDSTSSSILNHEIMAHVYGVGPFSSVSVAAYFWAHVCYTYHRIPHTHGMSVNLFGDLYVLLRTTIDTHNGKHIGVQRIQIEPYKGRSCSIWREASGTNSYDYCV